MQLVAIMSKWSSLQQKYEAIILTMPNMNVINIVNYRLAYSIKQFYCIIIVINIITNISYYNCYFDMVLLLIAKLSQAMRSQFGKPLGTFSMDLT